MSPAPNQPDFSPGVPPMVRWRSWPARQCWLCSALVVAGLVAGGWLVRWMTDQAWLPWLAAAALVAAFWRWFVPVDYRLGPKGVDQRIFGRRYHLPWQAIGPYEVCRSGAALLPASPVHPLHAFDGLYVAWSGHRDEVLRHLAYYLGDAEEPREP
jgi:hypothetical protein